MTLSKEANRAKYQYAKSRGYMERYWEKKARLLNDQTVTPAAHKTAKVSVQDELLPDVEEIDVSVCRKDYPADEKYIKALENANKSYQKENRRLVKLVVKYQEVIRLGLKAIGV